MMSILANPLTWFIVAIFFLGSFKARESLADRFWFTVIMPIVYAMLWCLCIMIVTPLGSFLIPSANENLMDGVSLVISTLFCACLFVLQIFAMSEDPNHRTEGYSLGKPGAKKSLQPRSTGLQKIPTRKRWSG